MFILYEMELDPLLNSGRELSVADFTAAWPGVPQATVYSRIRALVVRGVLSQVGRGRYVAVRKPAYAVDVTPWMVEVNEFLNEHCPGVNHCISQRGCNLSVEVARGDVPVVLACLRELGPKVVLSRDVARFPAPLEGYIVVGVLVSDAPVMRLDGCVVPSLEKRLVDSLREPGSGGLDFQRASEVYSLNADRMRRYAARRGLSEELDMRLAGVDPGRVALFSRIQKYFSETEDVVRAWVFGSFARREETAQSDLDLLVDYDPARQVSLLDAIRHRIDLEKIAGRSVDLVENGTLKPFALPSAEQDKYLIYER